MDIRVISSRSEIPYVKPTERAVHFSFRPSVADVFSVVRTCPKIEVIQLPRSYIAKISQDIRVFCEDQRIQLIQGDVWGHRSDRVDHYTTPKFVLDRIAALKAGGVPLSDIISEIAKTHRMTLEKAAMVVKE